MKEFWKEFFRDEDFRLLFWFFILPEGLIILFLCAFMLYGVLQSVLQYH